MYRKRLFRRAMPVALLSVVGLVSAACGGAASSGNGEDTVTLTFANSYPMSHPHNKCGTQVVKKKIESQELGMTVEIFANSQLGGDTERFPSVQSGDIDIDLQGGSALSTSYPPIGVLDMFYAFPGPDELFNWFDSDASQKLKREFKKKTDVKILDAWFFGYRDFTANSPIRKPADLKGQRIRFPDSPIYLQAAKAIGANATPVAFEELYLALQQGIVDGQENPVSLIKAKSLNEVQDYVSLTDHQTGAQLVIVSSKTWNELSKKQQQALDKAVHQARAKDRQCIEQARKETLDKWRQPGGIKVIDDVHRKAFQSKVVDYYLSHLKGRQLELYKAFHGK